MSPKILEKLDKKITNLQGEVSILRSFMIGNLAKDKEGKYRPEFARKVLRSSKEKAGFNFKDSKSFLKKIQQN